jgi:2-polyprenyl-3-methyl-5-hydroxy-6-metoxy-1,4-benzoquinol methylase
MSGKPDGSRGIAMEWGTSEPTHAHPYLAPTIIQWLKDAGARTVLDLGCGNGALTLSLASAGFDVTGVDASLSGIQIASTATHANTRFRQGWIDDNLPDDLRHRFDAVVAAEVIEHLPKPSDLCRRADEALTPSGRLILTTPYHGYLKNLALALANQFDDHWHPLRDGGHIKFFSPSTITELLKQNGYSVTQLVRRGRIPPLAKSMIVSATRSSRR